MIQIDPLQIKIEKAKMNLSAETLEAIDAVDWRQALLDIKAKYGFSIEQLEALEVETELMMCGLLDPSEYEKEVRERMHVIPQESKDVVNEMNERVFKKIREAFMKILEKQKTIVDKTSDTSVLKTAGIEVVDQTHTEQRQTYAGGDNREDILEKVEHPELIVKKDVDGNKGILSMNKLSETFKIPTAQTEYSLSNITKEENKGSISTPVVMTPKEERATLPKLDPYRELPE